MAIKNFLFSVKKNKVFIFFLVSVLAGCQNMKTRSEIKKSQTTTPSTSATTSAPSVQESVTAAPDATLEVNKTPAAPLPKIGIIFGPGALRAYAHIGVLQEFIKAKIPLHAVAGLEMGSLIAAIYAHKAQPYDVEWQMMKLKEDDFMKQSLLQSAEPQDPKKMLGFFKNALGNVQIADTKIPFTCPAFNLSRQQMYLLNQGSLAQLLPNCLSFYPLYKPADGNVAGVTELKMVVDHLRSVGSNYIIYVNVLSARNGPYMDEASNNEVFWNMASRELAQQFNLVDFVIQVPLQDFKFLDFAHRREMIQRGAQAGMGASQNLVKKWGL